MTKPDIDRPLAVLMASAPAPAPPPLSDDLVARRAAARSSFLILGKADGR